MCSTHIEEMFGDSHILKSLKHLGETPKVLCIDCVNKQEFNWELFIFKSIRVDDFFKFLLALECNFVISDLQ